MMGKVMKTFDNGSNLELNVVPKRDGIEGYYA